MYYVKGGYASQTYWHSLRTSKSTLILLFMLERVINVTLDCKTKTLGTLAPRQFGLNYFFSSPGFKQSRNSHSVYNLTIFIVIFTPIEIAK